MHQQKQFSIVSSEETGVIAAWPGDDQENAPFLGSRKVLAVVEAQDDQAALVKWRAIDQGTAPCLSSI